MGILDAANDNYIRDGVGIQQKFDFTGELESVQKSTAEVLDFHHEMKSIPKQYHSLTQSTDKVILLTDHKISIQFSEHFPTISFNDTVISEHILSQIMQDCKDLEITCIQDIARNMLKNPKDLIGKRNFCLRKEDYGRYKELIMSRSN